MTLRKKNEYCQGEGLDPIESLDLRAINSFDELLTAMSKTAFGGRRLGEAADVLTQMVEDPSCRVVMTLSGAMTIAKMGLVAAEMVERGWVQAIVSTGAIMCHGFVEGSGRSHFKYKPSMNDEELFKKGYNRVYDTLELETSLDDIELIIRELLQGGKVEREQRGDVTSVSSRTFARALGEWLVANTEVNERGLLKSCFQHDVPVYIPAFTDSELAIDYNIYCKLHEEVPFDPFLDMDHYTDFIAKSETVGIFTIGGGVPRNWAQQAAPNLDFMAKHLEGDIPTPRVKYAVRLCPEPVHFGGLSGCTYSEGVSWGKFVPPSEGGRFAEVYCDATIAWPILVKAVMERVR